MILVFTLSPLVGTLGFREIGTSVDQRWKWIEEDWLDESVFVRLVEAARFVVDMVFLGGDEVHLWVGLGLFVKGLRKNLSSFKDKTFICLIREEVFIPDKGGELKRGSGY